LSFQIFDCFSYKFPLLTKEERHFLICGAVKPTNRWSVIEQIIPESHEDIDNYYLEAKNTGHEGLALFRRDSKYKFGRFTETEAKGFKMKETTLEWDAEIMSVAEGTVARPGAEKTTNELGRSVTSKKKEDRIPGGYACGFNVRLDDGRLLSPSLKGYDQAAKVKLWQNRKLFEGTGKWIIITGMAPVKIGGMPRSVHYIKGNSRAEK
jgi:hypothetical protein